MVESQGHVTRWSWNAKDSVLNSRWKEHPNPFPFTQIQSCLRLFRITPLLIERLSEHNGIPFTLPYMLPSKVISEPGFLLYWNRYHEMLSHTSMFLLFPPINDPSTTSSYFIAQNRSHSAKPYRLLSMDFLCTDSEHVSPIAFPYVLLFIQTV